MAKKASSTMVKAVALDSNLLLKILIGLLFICIGIQGCLGNNDNGLYRAIDNEAFNIILGIVLILCGVLMIIPSFFKGINNTYVKISLGIISIVWILVIVFSDFVYGLKGVNGSEWFYWLESLIYHLMVLLPIIKVTVPSIKK